VHSDFALPSKAERPKVVISCPRAKPCATNALPVLPVAPKMNNRIDANYTLAPTERYVFEKNSITTVEKFASSQRPR
jgi:hypothetical protein